MNPYFHFQLLPDDELTLSFRRLGILRLELREALSLQQKDRMEMECPTSEMLESDFEAELLWRRS